MSERVTLVKETFSEPEETEESKQTYDPMPRDEAGLWSDIGYSNRDMLDKWAHSLGKGNYEDIGRYALQGLLATPLYHGVIVPAERQGVKDNYAPNSLAQAMARVAFEHTTFSHHPFDDLDIRRKVIQYDKKNQPVAVLPGETQQEYLDQGGHPFGLRDPNMWVVATESIARFHARLAPMMAESGPYGTVIFKGRAEEVALNYFGKDEMDTLYLTGLLGNKEWRAPYERVPASSMQGYVRPEAAWRDAA